MIVPDDMELERVSKDIWQRHVADLATSSYDRYGKLSHLFQTPSPEPPPMSTPS